MEPEAEAEAKVTHDDSPTNHPINDNTGVVESDPDDSGGDDEEDTIDSE
jgi:hypothetical protein